MDINQYSEQYFKFLSDNFINSITTQVSHRLLENISLEVSKFDIKTQIDQKINQVVDGAIQSYKSADLQGAEFFALQGLGDYLKDALAIQVEAEWKPQYLDQPLANEVMEYLENNNFKFIKHNGISDGGWFSEIIMYNQSFKK